MVGGKREASRDASLHDTSDGTATVAAMRKK